MYVAYILLCSDNSYSTGLTNDFEKRIWQHETGYFPGCYTFKRRPVKLAWQRVAGTAGEANKLERQIKGWSRKKKAALISNDIERLKILSNQKKDLLRQAQGASNQKKGALRQAHGARIDYLIIGQGLCGTWLSWFLLKENKSFVVIDKGEPVTPSKVSAGIINPVTGRRMVEVWKAEQILSFAHHAYSEMGNFLGIDAITQKTIIDFFPNPHQRQVFLDRIKENDKYLHSYPEQNHFNEFFNYDLGCGEIRHSYIAHIDALLAAWRTLLRSKRCLLEQSFDINDLRMSTDAVQYEGLRAEKIIFCDGLSSCQGQFFGQLPFAPNKGEALIVEIPGLPGTHIYKKGFLLAPLGNDKFWLGSNYQWSFSDMEPTIEFYQQAERHLAAWVKLPFRVIEHMAALRPATLERRPFVGVHPHFERVGILNGMGTKGCSLAPYFASQLVRNLLFKDEIDRQADVRRFQRILRPGSTP